MDLLSDQPFDGRPSRVLAVVDVHTRESLAIVARAGFRTLQVVEVLDRLVAERGRPQVIEVDNGPEFAGRMLDQWACLDEVELDLSRPGRPADNARIEASDGRLRAECLNASWFLSSADARGRIERWGRDHNEERPHPALGSLTPRAFAAQAHPARRVA